MNCRLLLAFLVFHAASMPALAQPPAKKKTPAPAAPNQKEFTDDEKAAAAAAATVAGGMGLCGIISIVLIGGAFVLAEIAPIAIAIYRSHPDTMAIVLITLFFGWTCVGWWIALIWAVKSIARPASVNVRVDNRGGSGGDFDFR